MKNLKLKIKKFFHRKMIVHSRYNDPAEFVKGLSKNGQKYIRVAFTNRQKIYRHIPVTDIKLEEVRHIIKLPSDFQKWYCGMFGLIPKVKMIQIKRPL